MKTNVQIEDIKEIENVLDIQLSKEQRVEVLNQFNRVVMDRADDWAEIIEDLIKRYADNKER